MDAGYATLDDQLIRNGAEEVVRQARAAITEEGLTVRTYIESGDPSGVLLDLSRQAELIVVGTRGRGGFVGRLLGSVSSALPAHAKCPTVVVPLCVAKRPEDDPEIQDRIVVGVDGSGTSERALRLGGGRVEVGGVRVAGVPVDAGVVGDAVEGGLDGVLGARRVGGCRSPTSTVATGSTGGSPARRSRRSSRGSASR